MNAELLTEKRNDIGHQQKLIEKLDEQPASHKATVENEVKQVQSVVKTDMKSYSLQLLRKLVRQTQHRKKYIQQSEMVQKKMFVAETSWYMLLQHFKSNTFIEDVTVKVLT